LWLAGTHASGGEVLISFELLPLDPTFKHTSGGQEGGLSSLEEASERTFRAVTSVGTTLGTRPPT
jgi:hypothetical protein